MKKIICLITFLLSINFAKAQMASTEINLNKINTSLLEELFIKKLNEYRVENKCATIKRDAILSLAAQDQASYMVSQKKITSRQTTKEKESTNKRVFFYKGTHEGINENLTCILIKKHSKAKSLKHKKLINTYEEAANALLENWKFNKEHLKNMMDFSADVYGIGFSLSQDSALYASQIFAYKPYKPIKSKGIIDSDFGVLPKNSTVCDFLNNYDVSQAVGSILIQNFDGMVYVKSEYLKSLKNYFSGAKDGIYIDIILRSQFTCENNISMHGSPIYDGTMLKPILFSEIFKNNKSKDNVNLFSPLCRVPDYFKNKVYGINIGIIKNGYSCDYSIYYTPPINNFDLLNLRPKWIYSKNKTFIEDTISGKIDLYIPFKRNETKILSDKKSGIEKKLHSYSDAIKEIKIKTFSSVEGSEEINIKLQEKRAQEIKKLLSTFLTESIPISFEIKENWDDFYYEIKNSPFAYLKNLTRTQIKKRLLKKSLLDSIDPLLEKTRTSSLEINLKTLVSYNTEADLMMASYQMAIENDDSLKIATIQNRLLDYKFENKITENEIINFSLPNNKKYLPLWTNYLALHITNPDKKFYYSARDTALKAIKLDSTFIPLQFNFCLLALNHLSYFGDTIIPIHLLEKKMNQAFKMAKDKKDSVLVNHMWLNYSILSLYNHNKLHEYDKLNKHLLNVLKYYPISEITEEEALYLGLLFNFYSRFNWTLKMLHLFLKEGSRNEDLLFVYLQTYGFKGDLPSEEWKKYLKLAKELNSERFNYWIDKVDFQNMRAKEIKKLFCEN